METVASGSAEQLTPIQATPHSLDYARVIAEAHGLKVDEHEDRGEEFQNIKFSFDWEGELQDRGVDITRVAGEPIEWTVDPNLECSGLTSAQAREAAHAMLRAADITDELNAAADRTAH